MEFGARANKEIFHAVKDAIF